MWFYSVVMTFKVCEAICGRQVFSPYGGLLHGECGKGKTLSKHTTRIIFGRWLDEPCVNHTLAEVSWGKRKEMFSLFSVSFFQ